MGTESFSGEIPEKMNVGAYGGAYSGAYGGAYSGAYGRAYGRAYGITICLYMGPLSHHHQWYEDLDNGHRTQQH